MSLMKDRNFPLLWGGQAISLLGDSIGQIAAIFAVMDMTHNSALAMAGIVACEHIPALLVGVWAGVFVDRWDYRKIMIFSDAIRLVLCSILVFFAVSGWLPGIYICMALMGVAAQFFNPAKGAILPDIVAQEDLAQANSMVSSSNMLLGAIGFALGGGIYALFGRGVCFAFDAFTFLLSAVSIFFMVVPAKVREKKANSVAAVYTELKAGMGYLAGNPLLITLFTGLFLASLGFGMVNTLGAKYYTDVLHVAKELYSLSGLLIGVGAVLGMGAQTLLFKKMPPYGLFVTGLGVLGVSLIATALSPSFYVVIPIMLFIGIGNVLFGAGFGTVTQSTVDESLRGRVFGIMNPAMTLATLVSAGAGSLLAGIIGLRMLFVIAGVLGLIGTVVAGMYKGQDRYTISAIPAEDVA